MEIKSIGLKDVDEFFKVNLVPLVAQAMKWRSDVSEAMCRVRAECGLGDTANIKQCVRVLIQRLASSADVTGLALREEDGLPVLVVTGGTLSPHLSRSLTTLEAALLEFRHMAASCDNLVRQLNTQFAVVTEMYDGLGDRCLAAGLKGKKRDKAHENFAWNARVIQGQMDLLEACRRDCRQRLQQMQSSQDMIAKYMQKDRSPATRGRPRLTVPLPPSTGEEHTPCHTPPTPATSTGDLRPKSILKKTNSTMEVTLLAADGEPASPRPVGTPPDPDTAL